MGKKLTAEEFIRRAKEVHGDKYDYSKVEYINATTKVCIICPEHGEFWQKPSNHLNGKGCPKCANNVKLTTEEFIKKAREVHGDKYDYSKVEYKNNNTKVCIICPEHGEFWQNPKNHLNGVGCKACTDEKRKGILGMNTEEWIKRAREVHGDKYDYSRVVYTGNDKKVIIGCPIHGWFEQEANSHIQGHGCPDCGGNRKINTKVFVAESKKLYPNKLKYDKCKYINSNTPVILYCTEKDEDGNEHGYYPVGPHNHLHGTYGCKKCQYQNIGKRVKENKLPDLIEKSKLKFGKQFLYNNINDEKGLYKFYCTEKDDNGIEHGYFTVKHPYSHLTLKYGGCPKCHIHQHTTESWVERAKLVHGDRYDYSKTDLNNRDEMGRILITCPIHGDFWQEPSNHLQGQGCQLCNRGLTKGNKLKLLTEYDLENMSHHQLIELISANALPKEFKKLVFSEAGSKKREDTVKELQKLYEDTEATEDEIEDVIENEINEEEKKYEEEHSNNINSTNTNSDSDDAPTTKLDDDVLPNVNDNIVAELVGYDKFNGQLVSYGEKNKFLVEVEKQKIWNRVLKEDEGNSKDLIDELIKLRETSSEWVSNVIDEFMDEYKKVQSIVPDEDYKFKYAPKLMQKLMVYKLTENDSYLNLCGTGAGKTNAFLMASRAVGANHSVIICPNSVKDTWEESIKVIYPNIPSVEYESIDDLAKISDLNCAFIIINYDKFSNGSMCTKDKMDNFIEVVKPQFVCFDEIHNAKARDEEVSIRNQNVAYFRQQCNEAFGEGFKVLGMTATPLINNLNEVKSLLELVTGKEFNEIGNKNTIENIHLAYKNLLLYGFRYVPDYGINVVDTEVNIDGEHLKETLITLKNGDVNAIEGTFINDKMDAVKNDLTPGTIVYTTFIDKIVPKIEKKLKEFGIKYRRYTGNENAKERKNILKSFAANEFDILVASSPVTTGINGLQECCNKIIFMSLPWTNAEYTQLIGRINRQGSVFDEVNIVFPCINITMENGKVWSWDNKRKNIIVKKKTLSDAVVDGVFSYTANIDRGKLLKGAIEALKNGEATEDFELNRKKISAVPKINITPREYSESIINETHRKANTEKSSTTHKRFIENPDEWYKYHEARKENMKDWPEIPYEYIASKIKNKNRVVADFGCGNNLMKTCIPNNKVYSFDHLPAKDENGNIDETVIVCDMAHTELEDESIDIAVFSLALWGTNYEDYFKEAYRVLNYDGLMYVAEPSAAYDATKRDELMEMIKRNGFTPVGDIEDRGKFFYITVIKK